MKYFRTRYAIALPAILASSDALANVGIPMLAVMWPALWLWFVPVVLIEAYVANRMIGVSYKIASKAFFIANGASTLVGVPVMWAILLVIEFALGSTLLSGELKSKASIIAMSIIGAPWIGPGTLVDVFIAFTILSVWFCLVSILIEYRVLRRKFDGVSYNAVFRCVVIANVATYTVITLSTALFLLLTKS